MFQDRWQPTVLPSFDNGYIQSEIDTFPLQSPFDENRIFHLLPVKHDTSVPNKSMQDIRVTFKALLENDVEAAEMIKLAWDEYTLSSETVRKLFTRFHVKDLELHYELLKPGEIVASERYHAQQVKSSIEYLRANEIEN